MSYYILIKYPCFENEINMISPSIINNIIFTLESFPKECLTTRKELIFYSKNLIKFFPAKFKENHVYFRKEENYLKRVYFHYDFLSDEINRFYFALLESIHQTTTIDEKISIIEELIKKINDFHINNEIKSFCFSYTNYYYENVKLQWGNNISDRITALTDNVLKEITDFYENLSYLLDTPEDNISNRLNLYLYQNNIDLRNNFNNLTSNSNSNMNTNLEYYSNSILNGSNFISDIQKEILIHTTNFTQKFTKYNPNLTEYLDYNIFYNINNYNSNNEEILCKSNHNKIENISKKRSNDATKGNDNKINDDINTQPNYLNYLDLNSVEPLVYNVSSSSPIKKIDDINIPEFKNRNYKKIFELYKSSANISYFYIKENQAINLYKFSIPLLKNVVSLLSLEFNYTSSHYFTNGLLNPTFSNNNSVNSNNYKDSLQNSLKAQGIKNAKRLKYLKNFFLYFFTCHEKLFKSHNHKSNSNVIEEELQKSIVSLINIYLSIPPSIVYSLFQDLMPVIYKLFISNSKYCSTNCMISFLIDTVFDPRNAENVQVKRELFDIYLDYFMSQTYLVGNIFKPSCDINSANQVSPIETYLNNSNNYSTHTYTGKVNYNSGGNNNNVNLNINSNNFFNNNFNYMSGVNYNSNLNYYIYNNLKDYFNYNYQLKSTENKSISDNHCNYVLFSSNISSSTSSNNFYYNYTNAINNNSKNIIYSNNNTLCNKIYKDNIYNDNYIYENRNYSNKFKNYNKNLKNNPNINNITTYKNNSNYSTQISNSSLSNSGILINIFKALFKCIETLQMEEKSKLKIINFLVSCLIMTKNSKYFGNYIYLIRCLFKNLLNFSPYQNANSSSNNNNNNSNMPSNTSSSYDFNKETLHLVFGIMNHLIQIKESYPFLKEMLTEIIIIFPIKFRYMIEFASIVFPPLLDSLNMSQEIIPIGLQYLEQWMVALYHKPENVKPYLQNNIGQLTSLLTSHLYKVYAISLNSLKLLSKLGGRARNYMEEKLINPKTSPTNVLIIQLGDRSSLKIHSTNNNINMYNYNINNEIIDDIIIDKDTKNNNASNNSSSNNKYDDTNNNSTLNNYLSINKNNTIDFSIDNIIDLCIKILTNYKRFNDKNWINHLKINFNCLQYCFLLIINQNLKFNNLEQIINSLCNSENIKLNNNDIVLLNPNEYLKNINDVDFKINGFKVNLIYKKAEQFLIEKLFRGIFLCCTVSEIEEDIEYFVKYICRLSVIILICKNNSNLNLGLFEIDPCVIFEVICEFLFSVNPTIFKNTNQTCNYIAMKMINYIIDYIFYIFDYNEEDDLNFYNINKYKFDYKSKDEDSNMYTNSTNNSYLVGLKYEIKTNKHLLKYYYPEYDNIKTTKQFIDSNKSIKEEKGYDDVNIFKEIKTSQNTFNKFNKLEILNIIILKILNSCYINEWSKKGGGLSILIILIKRLPSNVIYNHLNNIIRAVFTTSNTYSNIVNVKFENDCACILNLLVEKLIIEKSNILKNIIYIMTNTTVNNLYFNDTNNNIDNLPILYALYYIDKNFDIVKIIFNSLKIFMNNILSNINSISNYTQNLIETLISKLYNETGLLKKSSAFIGLIDIFNEEDFIAIYYSYYVSSLIGQKSLYLNTDKSKSNKFEIENSYNLINEKYKLIYSKDNVVYSNSKINQIFNFDLLDDCTNKNDDNYIKIYFYSEKQRLSNIEIINNEFNKLLKSCNYILFNDEEITKEFLIINSYLTNKLPYNIKYLIGFNFLNSSSSNNINIIDYIIKCKYNKNLNNSSNYNNESKNPINIDTDYAFNLELLYEKSQFYYVLNYLIDALSQKMPIIYTKFNVQTNNSKALTIMYIYNQEAVSLFINHDSILFHKYLKMLKNLFNIMAIDMFLYLEIANKLYDSRFNYKFKYFFIEKFYSTKQLNFKLEIKNKLVDLNNVLNDDIINDIIEFVLNKQFNYVFEHYNVTNFSYTPIEGHMYEVFPIFSDKIKMIVSFSTLLKLILTERSDLKDKLKIYDEECYEIPEFYYDNIFNGADNHNSNYFINQKDSPLKETLDDNNIFTANKQFTRSYSINNIRNSKQSSYLTLNYSSISKEYLDFNNNVNNLDIDKSKEINNVSKANDINATSNKNLCNKYENYYKNTVFHNLPDFNDDIILKFNKIKQEITELVFKHIIYRDEDLILESAKKFIQRQLNKVKSNAKVTNIIPETELKKCIKPIIEQISGSQLSFKLINSLTVLVKLLSNYLSASLAKKLYEKLISYNSNNINNTTDPNAQLDPSNILKNNLNFANYAYNFTNNNDYQNIARIEQDNNFYYSIINLFSNLKQVHIKEYFKRIFYFILKIEKDLYGLKYKSSTLFKSAYKKDIIKMINVFLSEVKNQILNADFLSNPSHTLFIENLIKEESCINIRIEFGQFYYCELLKEVENISIFKVNIGKNINYNSKLNYEFLKNINLILSVSPSLMNYKFQINKLVNNNFDFNNNYQYFIENNCSTIIDALEYIFEFYLENIDCFEMESKQIIRIFMNYILNIDFSCGELNLNIKDEIECILENGYKQDSYNNITNNNNNNNNNVKDSKNNNYYINKSYTYCYEKCTSNYLSFKPQLLFYIIMYIKKTKNFSMKEKAYIFVSKRIFKHNSNLRHLLNNHDSIQNNVNIYTNTTYSKRCDFMVNDSNNNNNNNKSDNNVLKKVSNIENSINYNIVKEKYYNSCKTSEDIVNYKDNISKDNYLKNNYKAFEDHDNSWLNWLMKLNSYLNQILIYFSYELRRIYDNRYLLSINKEKMLHTTAYISETIKILINNIFIFKRENNLMPSIDHFNFNFNNAYVNTSQNTNSNTVCNNKQTKKVFYNNQDPKSIEAKAIILLSKQIFLEKFTRYYDHSMFLEIIKLTVLIQNYFNIIKYKYEEFNLSCTKLYEAKFNSSHLALMMNSCIGLSSYVVFPKFLMAVFNNIISFYFKQTQSENLMNLYLCIDCLFPDVIKNCDPYLIIKTIQNYLNEKTSNFNNYTIIFHNILKNIELIYIYGQDISTLIIQYHYKIYLQYQNLTIMQKKLTAQLLGLVVYWLTLDNYDKINQAKELNSIVNNNNINNSNKDNEEITNKVQNKSGTPRFSLEKIEKLKDNTFRLLTYTYKLLFSPTNQSTTNSKEIELENLELAKRKIMYIRELLKIYDISGNTYFFVGKTEKNSLKSFALAYFYYLKLTILYVKRKEILLKIDYLFECVKHISQEININIKFTNDCTLILRLLTDFKKYEELNNIYFEESSINNLNSNKLITNNIMTQSCYRKVELLIEKGITEFFDIYLNNFNKKKSKLIIDFDFELLIKDDAKNSEEFQKVMNAFKAKLESQNNNKMFEIYPHFELRYFCFFYFYLIKTYKLNHLNISNIQNFISKENFDTYNYNNNNSDSKDFDRLLYYGINKYDNDALLINNYPYIHKSWKLIKADNILLRLSNMFTNYYSNSNIEFLNNNLVNTQKKVVPSNNNTTCNNKNNPNIGSTTPNNINTSTPEANNTNVINTNNNKNQTELNNSTININNNINSVPPGSIIYFECATKTYNNSNHLKAKHIIPTISLNIVDLSKQADILAKYYFENWYVFSIYFLNLLKEDENCKKNFFDNSENEYFLTCFNFISNLTSFEQFENYKNILNKIANKLLSLEVLMETVLIGFFCVIHNNKLFNQYKSSIIKLLLILIDVMKNSNIQLILEKLISMLINEKYKLDYEKENINNENCEDFNKECNKIKDRSYSNFTNININNSTNNKDTYYFGENFNVKIIYLTIEEKNSFIIEIIKIYDYNNKKVPVNIIKLVLEYMKEYIYGCNKLTNEIIRILLVNTKLHSLDIREEIYSLFEHYKGSTLYEKLKWIFMADTLNVQQSTFNYNNFNVNNNSFYNSNSANTCYKKGFTMYSNFYSIANFNQDQHNKMNNNYNYGYNVTSYQPNNVSWILYSVDFILSHFKYNSKILKKGNVSTLGVDYLDNNSNNIDLEKLVFYNDNKNICSNSLKFEEYMNNIREIILNEMSYSQKIWYYLFPQIWKTLSKENQENLSVYINDYLVSLCSNIQQNQKYPIIIKYLVEALTNCIPVIHIKPELMMILVKNFSCWNSGVFYLEQMFNSNINIERNYICLNKIYNVLKEEDFCFGLKRKYLFKKRKQLNHIIECEESKDNFDVLKTFKFDSINETLNAINSLHIGNYNLAEETFNSVVKKYLHLIDSIDIYEYCNSEEKNSDLEISINKDIYYGNAAKKEVTENSFDKRDIDMDNNRNSYLNNVYNSIQKINNSYKDNTSITDNNQLKCNIKTNIDCYLEVNCEESNSNKLIINKTPNMLYTKKRSNKFEMQMLDNNNNNNSQSLEIKDYTLLNKNKFKLNSEEDILSINEIAIWNEGLVDSYKNLNKWSEVKSIAIKKNDLELKIESMWHLGEWSDIEKMNMNKYHYLPKLNQIYMMMQHDSSKLDNQYQNICMDGIKAYFSDFSSFPLNFEKINYHYYLIFQQLVEAWESANTLKEMERLNKDKEKKLPEFRENLTTWRERLPHLCEGFPALKSILDPRNFLFNIKIANYKKIWTENYNSFVSLNNSNINLNNNVNNNFLIQVEQNYPNLSDQLWNYTVFLKFARKLNLKDVYVEYNNVFVKQSSGFEHIYPVECYLKNIEDFKFIKNVTKNYNTGLNLVNKLIDNIEINATGNFATSNSSALLYNTNKSHINNQTMSVNNKGISSNNENANINITNNNNNLFNNDLNKEIKSNYLCFKAFFLFKNNCYDASIECYKEAIVLNKTNYKIWKDYANVSEALLNEYILDLNKSNSDSDINNVNNSSNTIYKEKKLIINSNLVNNSTKPVIYMLLNSIISNYLMACMYKLDKSNFFLSKIIYLLNKYPSISFIDNESIVVNTNKLNENYLENNNKVLKNNKISKFKETNNEFSVFKNLINLLPAWIYTFFIPQWLDMLQLNNHGCIAFEILLQINKCSIQYIYYNLKNSIEEYEETIYNKFSEIIALNKDKNHSFGNKDITVIIDNIIDEYRENDKYYNRLITLYKEIENDNTHNKLIDNIEDILFNINIRNLRDVKEDIIRLLQKVESNRDINCVYKAQEVYLEFVKLIQTNIDFISNILNIYTIEEHDNDYKNIINKTIINNSYSIHVNKNIFKKNLKNELINLLIERKKEYIQIINKINSDFLPLFSYDKLITQQISKINLNDSNNKDINIENVFYSSKILFDFFTLIKNYIKYFHNKISTESNLKGLQYIYSNNLYINCNNLGVEIPGIWANRLTELSWTNSKLHISRFESEYHNNFKIISFVSKKLLIRSTNEKLYIFNTSYENNYNEFKLHQFQSVLNNIFIKYKDTYKRGIKFNIPLRFRINKFIKLCQEDHFQYYLKDISDYCLEKEGVASEIEYDIFESNYWETVKNKLNNEHIESLSFKGYNSLNYNYETIQYINFNNQNTFIKEINERVYEKMVNLLPYYQLKSFIHKFIVSCDEIFIFRKQFCNSLSLNTFLSYVIKSNSEVDINNIVFNKESGLITYYNNMFLNVKNFNRNIKNNKVSFRFTNNINYFLNSSCLFGVAPNVIFSCSEAVRLKYKHVLSILNVLLYNYEDNKSYINNIVLKRVIDSNNLSNLTEVNNKISNSNFNKTDYNNNYKFNENEYNEYNELIENNELCIKNISADIYSKIISNRFLLRNYNDISEIFKTLYNTNYLQEENFLEGYDENSDIKEFDEKSRLNLINLIIKKIKESSSSDNLKKMDTYYSSWL